MTNPNKISLLTFIKRKTLILPCLFSKYLQLSNKAKYPEEILDTKLN